MSFLPYREVIEAMECFHLLECNIHIARDRDDDNGVEKYLVKSKGDFSGWVSFVWEYSNGLLCVGEKIVVPLDEKQERLVNM